MGAGPPTNQITNQEDKFIKTAIIYCSRHQGNTKKLIDAITSQYPVELFNVNELKTISTGPPMTLLALRLVSLWKNFINRYLKYAERFMPNGQRIFILFTSGAPGAARFKKTSRNCRRKKCSHSWRLRLPGILQLFSRFLGWRPPTRPSQSRGNQRRCYFLR